MIPLQKKWFADLKTHRAIAIIRAEDWQLGLKMAATAIAGGMKIIEITWNSDQPAKIVTTLREKFPACRIGVGTILDSKQLRDAMQSGAEFAFSPHSNQALVNIAHNGSIPMVLGAMTPTEIMQAWQYGSDGVKVFPIKSIGGAEFIHCLQAPIGHIPLIPTGGVTLANGATLLKAGAIAVGLSSDLFPAAAVQQQNWQQLIHRIQEYCPRQWQIEPELPQK